MTIDQIIKPATDLRVTAASIFPDKVFAKPFRLAFLRHTKTDSVSGEETSESYVTWIEIKSLSGLEQVTSEIATGELTPVNAWATLDRQLWGLLAEHTGFLRYEGPSSEGSAGIRPLGSSQAHLQEDMEEIFGGFEPAIEALGEIRNRIIEGLESESTAVETNNSDLIKSDGVNLTREGEALIAKTVYGDDSDRAIKLQMETANAGTIMLNSDPSSASEEAIKEIDAAGKDLQTYSGHSAAEQGRMVERAAEGDLDQED